MVQANALLVAIALTVTVPPALAAPIPTCEQIQKRAKNLPIEKIRAMPIWRRLTDEQRAYVENCLKDKK